MHLMYAAPGPNEVGRSGSYDSFEVQVDFRFGKATILGYNKDDESWTPVVEVQDDDSEGIGDGAIVIVMMETSAIAPPETVSRVASLANSVFIDTD